MKAISCHGISKGKSLHKCMGDWTGVGLYNSAAWLPSRAAVGSSTRHDLASFENWKVIALDLNGGRIKPYPESFIRYVSYVHASIMQRGEK